MKLRILFILGLACAVCFLVGCEHQIMKSNTPLVTDREDFTRQIEVPSNSKILEILHRGGNVSIIGWEKPYILIEGSVRVTADSVTVARAIVEQIEVMAYERPTNRLVLDYQGPANITKSTREEEGIDYIANVPRALVLDLEIKHGALSVSNMQNDIWIDHRLGDIKVESIDGDLQIRTESSEKQPGSVTVRSIKKNLTVDTKYAKLDIQDVGGELDVLHAHGNITISGAGRGASIESQNSELDLRGIQGFLKVNNDRGDVVCEDIYDGIIANLDRGTLKLQPNVPLIRGYTCEVNTGNIILRVPENTGMLVELRAESGSIHSDFSLPVSADRGMSFAKGAVNEGRPMVRLAVRKGGVTLLKMPPASFPKNVGQTESAGKEKVESETRSEPSDGLTPVRLDP